MLLSEIRYSRRPVTVIEVWGQINGNQLSRKLIIWLKQIIIRSETVILKTYMELYWKLSIISQNLCLSNNVLMK